jgi:sterol desaturase/sphingolipid hydroxylase (fatty acid hydroxylase superfamily)
MLSLIIAAAAVVIASFVGYWLHRAMHQPWAGPFYRGHMQHHLEIYPTTRLTSDSYEQKEWYNSGPVLFTPGALALLVVAGVATWLFGVSLWHFLVFGGVLVGFGLLNDYVHDSFHLRVHWLQALPYYRKLRRWHFQHHFDMTKNFGIVAFQWDDAFKTKED